MFNLKTTALLGSFRSVIFCKTPKAQLIEHFPARSKNEYSSVTVFYLNKNGNQSLVKRENEVSMKLGEDVLSQKNDWALSFLIHAVNTGDNRVLVSLLNVLGNLCAQTSSSKTRPQLLPLIIKTTRHPK